MRKVFKLNNLEKKCEKYSSNLVGLIQATVVFFYILLIAIFMIRAQGIVSATNSITGPVMAILLFVMSAVFMVIAVFAYPVYIYSIGETKRAISIVVHSFFWLLIIFVLFLVSLAIGVGSTSGF